MKKNLPPFYVGQMVVAIKGHSQGIYKKGQEFVVLGLYKSNCGCWNINVGIKSRAPKTYCITHPETIWLNNGESAFGASGFAPIEETFQSITLEKVLENETSLIGAN